MKQKRHHKLFNRYTMGALVLLVVAAASVVVVTNRNRTDATPSVKPGVGAAIPSQFSFSGTTDWWQGATNKTSMALFHSLHDSCFVSVQHKTGSIDADKAKLQKSDADLTSSGHTITPGATLAATLQTNTGQQSYQLQQSSVTSPTGASKVLGGQEFGYLPLSNGDYLYVEGYCDTPAELAATLPALQAVKFDAAK